MAQTQAIKRRIRSVANTRQITKAMELVAASKMRRAQDAARRSRAYTRSAREVLARLHRLPNAQVHPFFNPRPVVRARLVVLITSDRGLAGAYNSNLLRLTAQELQADREQGIRTRMIVVGRQGIRFVSRLEGVEVIGAYPDFPTEPTSVDVRPIIETATRLFDEGKIDQIDVIFTHFASAIRQDALTRTLVPIARGRRYGLVEEFEQDHDEDVTRYEPSPQLVLESIVPRLVEARLFQAFLEASASEQSMRMMAMKSASDNANDLIDDLTLEYNGARQASITQELAEITAGAEAIA